MTRTIATLVAVVTALLALASTSTGVAAPIAPGVASTPLQWQRTLAAPVTGLRSTSAGLVAVSAGRAVVLDPASGTVRGGVGTPTGALSTTIADTHVIAVDRSGLSGVPVDRRSGGWHNALDVGGVAVDDGIVYAATAASSPRLLALDADSGQQLWSWRSRRSREHREDAVSVAAGGGVAYLVAGRSMAAVVAPRVAAGTRANNRLQTTSAGDRAGDRRVDQPVMVWRADVDAIWSGAVHALPQGVVTASRSGRVCLRELSDGALAWCRPVRGVAQAPPTVHAAGDQIYVVTSTAVTALDVDSGVARWTSTGRWRGGWLDDGAGLLVADAGGALRLLAADTGSARTLPGVRVARGGAVATDAERIYVTAPDGTVRASDRDGHAEGHAVLKSLRGGEVAAPETGHRPQRMAQGAS